MLRSEHRAVLGKPSSVLLKQGFWGKKKSPTKPLGLPLQRLFFLLLVGMRS